MDYQYDCFISYAHKDNESSFAQQLAAWLEQAQLKVWRDSSGMLGGQSIQKSIQHGLRSSGCLICLVTEAWYESKFTQWELEVFADCADDRTIVPVYLTRRDPARLGPELAHRKGISGLDDPATRHAAFWELYCALTGRDLGREDDWTTRGRELLERLPAGTGGLFIFVPEDIPASAIRVSTPQRGSNIEWDGSIVHLPPGLVRVVLRTDDMYDECVANIAAGKTTNAHLYPTGVIWPTSEPKFHPGSGAAREMHIYVVYERATQQRLAARIAYIANRLAGHSVLLDQWVYFKERGDGAMERFASANTLFYHQGDRADAQALQRHFQRATPPIRLAWHEGGDQPTPSVGVERFPDGFHRGRMHILLLESTVTPRLDE